MEPSRAFEHGKADGTHVLRGDKLVGLVFLEGSRDRRLESEGSSEMNVRWEGRPEEGVTGGWTSEEGQGSLEPWS